MFNAKLRYAFAVLAALMGSNVEQARALEFKLIPSSEAGVSILEMSGRFETGDGLKFRAELAKAPAESTIVIHLKAAGGFPAEAMSIGRIVHRTGIKTIVPPKARCLSPCPLVFVSGFDRRKNEAAMVKHSTGTIGVTSTISSRKEQDYTYKDLDAAIAGAQKTVLQVADYLQEMSVDIDFLRFYVRQPEELNKTNEIKDEQLLEIGASIYDDNSKQLIDGQALRRRRQ
jgi:hypothetical protein